MTGSRNRRVSGASGCPTVRAGIVSAAGVDWPLIPPQMIISLPSRLRCECIVEGALVVLVAVQLSVPGLYLPPVLRVALTARSAPDDHFASGPHCRVIGSCGRRVCIVGRHPTVRSGIVSSAGVRKRTRDRTTAPDNHFAAGPHCRGPARPSGGPEVAAQVSSMHLPPSEIFGSR